MTALEQDIALATSRARLAATKLRGLALAMRNAVDAFRRHTADGQALDDMDRYRAKTLDHTCMAWLTLRGYKVTGTPEGA